MKVIFVIRSVLHFSYHESVVENLLKSGHSVELVFDRLWSKNQKGLALQEFLERHKGLDSKITSSWLKPRTGIFAKTIFTLRELRTYASYLSRPNQSSFYRLRWESYLPNSLRIMVRKKLAKKVLQAPLSNLIFRLLENLIPASKAALADLSTRHCDVVVASPANLRFSQEVEYIKAAKKLGIFSVISVMSWDNLSTKGLLHVIPNRLLVWNRHHADEAESIHNIPKENIVITGAPFFDKWFNTNKQKVTSEKPYVVYLGSSANIAKDETWLVEQIARELDSSKDPFLRSLDLIVRPHGANQQVYQRLDHPKINLSLRETEFLLPDSSKTKKEFHSLLENATCVIGLNTTAMLDSILIGTPVIAMMVQKYTNKNTLSAVHFKQLLEWNLYEYATSAEQCLEKISNLSTHGSSKTKNWVRFTSEAIRPRGVNHSAGGVAAHEIIDLCQTEGVNQ